MTTIIIVVVVALVFFVAVCVVTFMVWKRESEMRTDSIKAIEQNLEKLAHELSSDTDSGNELHRMSSVINAGRASEVRRRRIYEDPFEWVREAEEAAADGPQEAMETIRQETEGKADFAVETHDGEIMDQSAECELIEEKSPGDIPYEDPEYESNAVTDSKEAAEPDLMEIDLDFIDNMDDDGDELSESMPSGYDTGRSGKRYTASELETLIKE